MVFQWPEMLWALAVLPLLVWAYWAILRRRARQTLALSDLSLVREALAAGPGWRRHVPPALMLVALALLLVAGARPMARVTLPSSQKTLILAMDVSGSMRATDVKPSRIVAAQSAAKKFLETLPRDVKVGIVAFAGAAQVAQLPTLNREDLVTAIDRFQLQRGTATGNSIVISLATLFPQAGIELQQMGQPARSTARPLDAPAAPEAKPREFTPVPPGSYTSAAIIMLTDGQRTTGVDPLEAAKMAADRGVRVYTVGIGTVDGETIGFEGWSMRVRLDEDTLKKIALQTQADYFYAGTAENLTAVYEKLGNRLSVETRETEVSGLFALAGALLVLLAAGLSLLWFRRVF
ncbi:MAG: VWA domain-containing protein [Burkholderiaceae bacterium]|jgi:Ca-activated chloride channel family protein|nr:VWA domain-containing protein [Burkholderiaceae bacterium]